MQKRKRLKKMGMGILIGLMPAVIGLLVLFWPQQAPVFEASEQAELDFSVFWVWETPNSAAQDCFGVKALEEVLPLRISFTAGSTDKFHASLVAGRCPDLVQAPAKNAQMKLFSQSENVLPVSELLSRALPSMQLPPVLTQWFADRKGKLAGYPHHFSDPAPPETERALLPAVVWTARKDLMTKYQISPSDFSTKHGTLEALKKIRKDEPELTPCAFDFDTLLWMFGGQFEDAQGQWQDVFLTPPALEAAQFLNTLYRERLLPIDTFTMSQQQLAQRIRDGKVFAVSGTAWYGEFADWEETNGEAAAFVPLSPVRSDSGTVPAAFPALDEKGAYVSLFCAKSAAERDFPRIALYFYLQDFPAETLPPEWQQTLSQGAALEALALAQRAKKEAPVQNASVAAIQDYFRAYTSYLYPFRSRFEYKFNTQIDSVSSATEEYKESQLRKMAIASSSDEVQRLYELTLQGIKNLNDDLVNTWKSTRYLEAKALCGVDSFRLKPAID